MLLKTALVQMDIAFGNPEVNYENASANIAEAVSSGADVILLPELWTTGYDFSYMKENPDEEASEAVTFLSEQARKHRVNLVAGSVAKKTDEGFFNTMLVFNRHGAFVREYSKAHLFRLMEEEKHLQEGNEGSLFKLEHGWAAGFICYDIRFPEWIRTHMLHPEHKPSVLYVVAEWPQPRIDQWRSLLIARAIENQCFVAACNRTGSDPNNTYGGHSIVISPLGKVIAEAGEAEDTILYADIETDDVHEIRENIPVLRDRRPELYRNE
ncbi:carbon-nitrogen family hydrolase [Alkalicoccus halolimnae]|uniref:Carbon-nitrogen family hydrolase n=1 Tax=Alkalicoccus halolimnae TaxID=1667239 RepID=A0A5C7FLK3_9BACI|nr:carbon-nitrogen family hydrolase [Alkalicoccus halolimnae]TXF85605.1 carbon-nitrogen family hydrolase [Alkalicoccus halolimnae]